jgi:GNAT superfamily N-acetyltransferase
VTLPEPVREFCYSALQLEGARRMPWGAVITDARFPLIWDANNATVLEPSPGLTLHEIQGTLDPALRAAAAPYEHIEFWDTSVLTPALRDLRTIDEFPAHDDVMVFDAARPAADDARVMELLLPDEDFWLWYRSTLLEFGQELYQEVLGQMVRRIRDVFVPAGLRFFAAALDGEMAGYTSAISLGGVGYLDNVVTMPAYRGRGVASATVARAVRECFEAGDRCVFLLAERGGKPQEIYERLGFRARAEVESFTRLLPPVAPLGRPTPDL